MEVGAFVDFGFNEYELAPEISAKFMSSPSSTDKADCCFGCTVAEFDEFASDSDADVASADFAI